MTLIELRLQIERRYWQDLLTRLPNFTAAARVADIDRKAMRVRLRSQGLLLGEIEPPQPPLPQHHIGLTFSQFMLRTERDYWVRLLATQRSVVAASKSAGVNRTTTYKRFNACGLSTRFSRKMLGRQLQYGNEAWQRLTADSRSHI